MAKVKIKRNRKYNFAKEKIIFGGIDGKII